MAARTPQLAVGVGVGMGMGVDGAYGAYRARGSSDLSFRQCGAHTPPGRLAVLLRRTVLRPVFFCYSLPVCIILRSIIYLDVLYKACVCIQVHPSTCLCVSVRSNNLFLVFISALIITCLHGASYKSRYYHGPALCRLVPT
jgi:hypothetical protein